ncbi:MAG: PilZ domain-containing protein [Pseudomonadota bacterium]
MSDYDEKRDFIRMPVELVARFRTQDSRQVASGLVQNLSATGVLIAIEQPIRVGTTVRVEVMPVKVTRLGLFAVAEVVRCEKTEEDEHFVMACTFTQMLSEREVGPDFP